jgi:TolB protein
MDDDSQIALIDHEGQLVLVRPDGSALRPVTQGERVFQFPAWAPDNQRLALIGGTEREAGVFVVAAATPTPTDSEPLYTTTTQPPIYLSWSPDGSLISLLAVHPDHRLALYLLLAANSVHDQLPPPVIGGQPCFWHWHGDSRGLLAHVELGQPSAKLAHVRWRNPHSPNIQPVDVRPGNFQAPAISADGRHIAYAQQTPDGDSQLVVASRERKYVIGEHNGTIVLNWSPQGERLAFLHPLTATHHFYGPLHLWRRESEQVQRVSAEAVVGFFWAPDGRQIAYFTVATSPRQAESEVPTSATNGRFKGEWPFLTDETPAPLELSLHLVNIEDATTRTLAVLTPSQPFLYQFLAFFDQYSKSHAIWSPQSDALVVPVEINGQPEIWVIQADGSGVRRVAYGTMATWSW